MGQTYGRGKWEGDVCTCKCGWACDQVDEKDQIRVCEKCGTKFERKSYGWCQVTNETKKDTV